MQPYTVRNALWYFLDPTAGTQHSETDLGLRTRPLKTMPFSRTTGGLYRIYISTQLIPRQ